MVLHSMAKSWFTVGLTPRWEVSSFTTTLPVCGCGAYIEYYIRLMWIPYRIYHTVFLNLENCYQIFVPKLSGTNWIWTHWGKLRSEYLIGFSAFMRAYNLQVFVGGFSSEFRSRQRIWGQVLQCKQQYPWRWTFLPNLVSKENGLSTTIKSLFLEFSLLKGFFNVAEHFFGTLLACKVNETAGWRRPAINIRPIGGSIVSFIISLLNSFISESAGQKIFR